jgi:putative spermidine/putrescine transport system permease protein
VRFGRRAALALLALPAVVYIVFLVLPIGNTFRMSFNAFARRTGIQPDWTTDQYRELASNSFYREVWVNTLRITLEAAVITVVFGAIVAYGIWRLGGKARVYVTALVLAPLLVSGVVRAYGWIAIGGPNGPWKSITRRIGLDGVEIIFNETSVIIGFVHVMFPFVVIAVLARLDGVKPSVVRAASNLGASQFGVVRRVLVPAVTPALVAGFLLVFALATSSYAVPSILGGGRVVTVAQVIYQEQAVTFNWPRAAALSLALTVVTMLLMLAYQWIARSRVRRAVPTAPS